MAIAHFTPWYSTSVLMLSCCLRSRSRKPGSFRYPSSVAFADDLPLQVQVFDEGIIQRVVFLRGGELVASCRP